MILGLLAAWAGTDQDFRMEEAVLQTRGRRSALMILWPRVLPHAEDPEVEAAAAAVQRRLEEIARQAAPLAPRQTAPRPQRVCPRTGCRGVSIGALIAQEDGGCAAVGLVNARLDGDTHLVPLAGDVELTQPTIAFRALPEEAVVVRDLVPCRDLAGKLDEPSLISAIRRMMTQP